jgi:hypothetical protein
MEIDVHRFKEYNSQSGHVRIKKSSVFLPKRLRGVINADAASVVICSSTLCFNLVVGTIIERRLSDGA